MIAPFHVLIVGGGIGGLCLAQGLKKAGVSVEVYERDASAEIRRHSYRISIDPIGNQALRNCLPENLFRLHLSISNKSETQIVFFDQQLKQDRSMPMRHTPPAGMLRTGVNRQTLREILLGGLEEIVHFDKTFICFEQMDGGQVRACFTDGTSATGNVLVAADGVNSAVRKLVVPDATLADVGRCVYGKTPITPKTLEWVPESFINGFVGISGSDGIRMVIGAYRKREEFKAATAMFAPTLHLTEAQDYLMWTLTGSLEQMPLTKEEFRAADGATLHRMVGGYVKVWHPSLRRLVHEADIPATFPIIIRSSNPVEHWPTTNVTLLGDAIHTMTPARGVGANTAMRDAELLCRNLIEVVAQRMSLLQAVGEYEAEMLRYGFEAVTNSLKSRDWRQQRLAVGIAP
jgi:2-polyprenyl-6-methoxyphenol hydroxylase-like FAD-dependent oxidoreductase